MNKEIKQSLAYFACILPGNLLLRLAFEHGHLTLRQVTVTTVASIIGGLLMFSYFRWISAQQNKKAANK